jgi:hypothetical protein
MTNNKQQTAVEWFIEELEEKGKAYEENQVVRTINICIDVSDYMELKQQAKEMDKERIIQAYSHGWHDGQDTIIMTIEHIDKGGDERGLKYYEQLQQTYGGGEQ